MFLYVIKTLKNIPKKEKKLKKPILNNKLFNN
jgi:hypothetical protein